MRFVRKTLKNGVRVILAPMPENPTAAVLVMAAAGSRYETKNINGISHFLEHMVFKGTPRRSTALLVSHEFDSLGASSNAFTWYEYTGYHAKAQTKHFGRILDIVSDLYQNPLFPEPELEREKGVIIQEINLYEDQPMHDVGHVFDKLLYGDQPAGWSVLGSKENIRRMRREDFLLYRKKYYTSSSTVIIAAGGIDTESALRAISREFGEIPKSKKVSRKSVIEKQRKPEVLLKYKKTDQSHFILGFRSVHADDKKIPAIEVLATILGRGMSSRLFQKLREEMGVCYYVRARSEEHSDSGTFTVSSGVDNARAPQVVSAVIEEFRRLCVERVSEGELAKAKEFIVGNMLMGLESSDDLASFYGTREILGVKTKTPLQIARDIRAVTSAEVERAARFLFTNNNLNLALVGPYKEKQKFVKVLKV